MSKQIIINGLRYNVIDNYGFQGDKYILEIRDGETLRMVVSNNRGGPWRFWDNVDRIGDLDERC